MDFQTPDIICSYMVGLLKEPYYKRVLEPTPGLGNLVKAVAPKAETVIAPDDYFSLDPYERYDAVVMNPPFTPMEKGYKILFGCMEQADEVIALMPWLVIINSKKRTESLMAFGMISITHLPRSIFKGARVQCCIIHLKKGYQDETKFINYH